MGKAIVVISLGDDMAAVGVYDRAIEIRERLVNVEGRRELLGDLARVKADRGLALILSGDTLRGEREAREAINVLRAEVKRTKRAELEEVLDRTARCLVAMRIGDR